MRFVLIGAAEQDKPSFTVSSPAFISAGDVKSYSYCIISFAELIIFDAGAHSVICILKKNLKK